MSRVKITEEELKDRVNSIIRTLKHHPNEWMRIDNIAEESGLKNSSQAKAAIKYLRRYGIEHPGFKVDEFYILSGKSGYKLPETDEELKSLYKTLYSWWNSLKTTISPVRSYLLSKGINVSAIEESVMHLPDEEDALDHGGEGSWHE